MLPILGFIAGAIAGGLVEYVLGHLLEDLKPKTRHFVAIFVFIFVFALFSFLATNEDSQTEEVIGALSDIQTRESEFATAFANYSDSQSEKNGYSLTAEAFSTEITQLELTRQELLNDEHVPTSTIQLINPQPQEVDWEPNDNSLGPGLRVSGSDEFVPWITLKSELEQYVLVQIPRIPVGSTLIMADHGGKQNWLVHVIGPNEEIIADVWIGNNPIKDWEFDGLIRIGRATNPPEVWSTFQRYTDSTYEMKQ